MNLTTALYTHAHHHTLALIGSALLIGVAFVMFTTHLGDLQVRDRAYLARAPPVQIVTQECACCDAPVGPDRFCHHCGVVVGSMDADR